MEHVNNNEGSHVRRSIGNVLLTGTFGAFSLGAIDSSTGGKLGIFEALHEAGIYNDIDDLFSFLFILGATASAGALLKR
ncbi:MAG: hypothetical protein ACJKTH_02255 [Patescibacteria group bacterium UBA2163]